MRTIVKPMITLLAVLFLGVTAAGAAQERAEEKSCGEVYRGKHSSVFVGECGLKIELREADRLVRIGRPLRPGPNSLPQQLEKKLFRKPNKWLKKTFGW